MAAQQTHAADTNVPTVELVLVLPVHLHGLMIAELDACGFTGFLQEDGVLRAYIATAAWSADKAKQLFAWLTQHEMPLAWQESEIAPKDWNQVWEASIEPISVPPFYVRPSWTPAAEGAIDIIVDPKMSFGTGHHESTRLLLKLLPDFIESGARVLDAGAGTGVLAIGAVKVGAKSALAFDIDPWVSDNVLENIRLNRVSPEVIYREGTLGIIPESGFDIILANINRTVLLGYLNSFFEKLAPAGHLLLSGVLRNDKAMMLREANRTGFDLVDEGHEGVWWAGAFQRP